jgi:D-mannonate dehydratase
MPERHTNVAEVWDVAKVAKAGRMIGRQAMANKPVRSTTIEVALDTKGQTRQRVLEAVDTILSNVKCPGCGLMHTISAKVVEIPTEK